MVHLDQKTVTEGFSEIGRVRIGLVEVLWILQKIKCPAGQQVESDLVPAGQRSSWQDGHLAKILHGIGHRNRGRIIGKAIHQVPDERMAQLEGRHSVAHLVTLAAEPENIAEAMERPQNDRIQVHVDGALQPHDGQTDSIAPPDVRAIKVTGIDERL